MAELRFKQVEKRFVSNANAGPLRLFNRFSVQKPEQPPVLKRLDILVHDQEFFVLVGPSGSGKSTLLNIAAGLEEVSSGDVYLDAQCITNLSPGERDVAMVFQNYALYPHLTIFENIAFPLRIRKKPLVEIKQEVEAIAQTLGISHKLGSRPRQLSGGQRQRVALARALVRRPKLFLLDEPLSNLDAALRVEMRTELKRLHNEYPVTTVYVTHDQEEALVLGQRIAVLNEGNVEQCGSPQEVFQKPANKFVAEFIGMPSMNFVSGAQFQEMFSGSDDALALSRNKDVIVGFRPKDLLIDSHEALRGESLHCNGKIIGADNVGNEAWVSLRVNSINIVCRGDENVRFEKGAIASAAILPERIHFFSAKNGNRIES